jgi:glycosyltransferase involved in cell wall biosynthesis
MVTESLAALYPESDIFCLFADLKRLPEGIPASRVHVSFLNRIPFAHRFNRVLFPLFAAAAGSFHLSDYDLIISSDSPPTKGIVTSSEAVHISYCHTPGRFIWDLAASFTAKLPWFFRPFFAEMASNARISDYVAAQRVDHFLANSNYVARRIRKYYGRNPTVMYPPVNVRQGYLSEDHDDYYLSVGRLIKNKRIDVLIHACNKLKRRLLIAGAGRDEKALKAIAGPTIEFLGRVPREQLGSLYARCRGFLFAADEDFGIVAVEAQGYGRPVIAFGFGGSLETVRVGDAQGRSDTGIFFSEQTPDSMADAILRFEAREHQFVPSEIREHALSFDAAIFNNKITEFIAKAMVAKEMSPAMPPQMGFNLATPWDGVTERRAPPAPPRRRQSDQVAVKVAEPISVGHRQSRSSVHSKEGR